MEQNDKESKYKEKKRENERGRCNGTEKRDKGEVGRNFIDVKREERYGK